MDSNLLFFSMKKPLLISLTALAVLGVTTATTLYAQTTTGSSMIARMKAAAAAFTLTADLNPGQTGLTSAPLTGKKTGDVLTAGEYNRLLELISQGSANGCSSTSGNVYDSGWVDFQGNPVQTLTHNLGTMDTVVFMEMKSDKDYTIAHTVPITLQPSKAHSAYSFMYTKWYNKTENTISVTTANNIETMSDRYVRIVMIKTSALVGGCGGSGGSSAPTSSNLTYINPDNTDFAPLVCTPGINYMINPIAFSAESASAFTTRKMAVLGAGNWQVKGTGFVRIRNKNSDVAQTLRVSSILDGTTTHLLDSALDLGMYANSFLAPVSIPAGKTAELQVSVKNNTLHGGNIVAWCSN